MIFMEVMTCCATGGGVDGAYTDEWDVNFRCLINACNNHTYSETRATEKGT